MALTKVQDGLVVGITYKVKLEDGEVVDESEMGDPLYYLHGADNIVPGLEKALAGLNLNESKTVKVTPEEGYGEYDEDATEAVQRGMFPPEMALEPGLMLTLEDDQGHLMDAVITEVADEVVTLDFNHPLAGETLFFEVKVVEIREATPEEREHGHPHMPGMHHHN